MLYFCAGVLVLLCAFLLFRLADFLKQHPRFCRSTCAFLSSTCLFASYVPYASGQESGGSSGTTPPPNPGALPPVPAAPPPLPSTPELQAVLTPEISALLAPSPSAQNVFIDIAQHNGTISYSTDFVNNNILTLFTSNPAFTSASIFAPNIFNAHGASITTVLPGGGYAGAINTPLNLVLNATGGIFNAGTIASSGNLSMTAQVIANVAPTPSMVAPVMQAVDNVSMTAGTLFNQGVIASALANINIASLTNSIAINSIGGTFSAPN